jgi:cytoskeleton protein RodZ
LGEIGELLKARRRELGLSLDDVYQVIKIRPRYLEAVEADRPDQVPAEVYYKGYIRSYGNFLGLNGPELVRRHVDAQRQGPKTAD